MKPSTPLLFALLLLTAVATVEGQSVPSNYAYIEDSQEASFYAGAFSGRTGQYGLGPKSGTMLGGRYLLEVGGPIFMEGRIGFIPTTRDIIDPRRDEGQRVIGETDANLFQFDARFGFSLTGRRTWRGLSPYVFSGGGLVFDAAGESPQEAPLPNNTRFDFGSAFTANFGGGLRYFVNQRLSVRVEGSVLLWKLKTPTGFDSEDSTLTNVEQDEWAGGRGLSIVLGWRF